MLNKNFFTKPRWLVTIILLLSLGITNAYGATTYKLTQITDAGDLVAGKYVFEDENGDWVLKPVISSSSLQTASTYSTTGLSGTENYVWTLAATDGGWYLKNSSGACFRNASSTNMSFVTTTETNRVWTFHFYSDGTAHIQNVGTERYIGVNGANIKPYTDTYIYYYKIYILEEEVSCSSNPTIGASSNSSFKWSTELEDIESPNSFYIYLVYFSMSKIFLSLISVPDSSTIFYLVSIGQPNDLYHLSDYLFVVSF